MKEIVEGGIADDAMPLCGLKGRDGNAIIGSVLLTQHN